MKEINTECITVSELIKQLQHIENMGYGDYKVWYRDYSTDRKITEGIWDICRDEKYKSVYIA